QQHEIIKTIMRRNIFIKTTLVLLSIVLLFHICMISKVIPYDIAWGGRLQNDNEMYVFETISIAINLFFGIVLLMKGGFIKVYFKPNLINAILWVFFALFILNTIGNLFSETNFEKLLSLLTLAFSILIWIILKAKK
ncbi:MAG TPA: hypothetical protein VKX31_00710, partial [Brumimicrobium sp.]|nr:hypothetical protein [Brumimicrobium sp.]